MSARVLSLGLTVAVLISGCWWTPEQIPCETDANCPEGMFCDETLTHGGVGPYACTEAVGADDDDTVDDDDTADDDDLTDDDDAVDDDDDDATPVALQVAVLSPQTDVVYFEGEQLAFLGTVLDPDGEPFAPPPSVLWSSNVDGALLDSVTDASGSTAFDRSLSEGAHVITLAAEASDSSTGQTSVTIDVSSVPPGLLDQDGDGWCPDGEDLDNNGQCEGDEVYGQPGSQDCDDDEPAVHPGAVEICDGIPDNNCDGVIDEEDSDADLDNYSPCQGDCDDGQPVVYPGAAEVCDGLDNNCDTALLPGGESDNDLDLYLTCDGDCDDNESLINPGATELCDAIDNDCDGTPDDDFDLDADGFVDGDEPGCVISYPADELDCDDANTAVNPGAVEICNDWDDDCDGFVNENQDSAEITATQASAVGPAEPVGGFTHILHAPPLASCPGATCQTYDGLLTLCRNVVSTSGTFSSAVDPVDAFVLDYDQLATTLGCAMNVGLSGIPSGQDYSLELWRTDSLSDPISDWDLLHSSDNAGAQPEAISQQATNTLDFSVDILVVVVRSKGFWACPSAGNYNLTITGG